VCTLKISLVEGPRRRRLIVEGRLIAPWVAEFKAACKEAIGSLHGRELIIDLRGVTAVSPDGESVLAQLMRKNVKFQCGVFMKELFKQLARKRPIRDRPAEDNATDDSSDGGEAV
jgi:hypothetical protein